MLKSIASANFIVCSIKMSLYRNSLQIFLNLACTVDYMINFSDVRVKSVQCTHSQRLGDKSKTPPSYPPGIAYVRPGIPKVTDSLRLHILQSHTGREFRASCKFLCHFRCPCTHTMELTPLDLIFNT